MTQPAPQTAPASDSGTVPMMLGILAGLLMVVGAMFFDWLSGVPSKGADNGAAIFWSTEVEGEPMFFTSAGFVVLIISAITLIASAMRRWGWVLYGGILAVLGFVLVMVTFYRVEGTQLGIGDSGLGLWMILAGGVLAIVAGMMARRATA